MVPGNGMPDPQAFGYREIVGEYWPQCMPRSMEKADILLKEEGVYRAYFRKFGTGREK